MFRILVAGAGKIGALIACLLLNSKKYDVVVIDSHIDGVDITRVKNIFPQLNLQKMDVTDVAALHGFAQQEKFSAVISSLPFYLNKYIAELAQQQKLHYFDLTEDIAVTETIKAIAKNATTAFVPQCGLAPGFTGIIAYDLLQQFESVDSIQCRVGAIPQYSNNALHYALTWSTDGVINEYINPCDAIKHGKRIKVPALEDLEIIDIAGEQYEAFNTSGGLGSLAELCDGKIETLNYKTIRYPGHCEKMRFLLEDLDLASEREILKKILERALPKTYQDTVLVYVTAQGLQNKEHIAITRFYKMLPQNFAQLEWSAIQMATASGICVIMDLVLQNAANYHGFIYQEQFSLAAVTNNLFGQYFLSAAQ